MSDKFKVAKLSDMEIPTVESLRWATVRSHLGVEAFGVNAWTANEAGQEVIGEHDEVSGNDARWHQELYVVLKGRATFTVDGEEVDAPPATLVFVRDPAARRKAVSAEPDTTVLALGAKPGEAFTSPQWERSAPALGFFATKEYDKAYDILAKAHEEHPDDALVLFNLACAESLLGRRDEAITHLEQSFAEDRFRELAKTDSDFDAIRDDPRFKQLVG